MLYFNIYGPLIGQVCLNCNQQEQFVKNGNLYLIALNPGTLCLRAYQKNYIPEWQPSHGTPHVYFKNNAGDCFPYFSNDPDFTCLASGVRVNNTTQQLENTSEGMFTDVGQMSSDSDVIYCVSFNANMITCPNFNEINDGTSDVFIYTANSLQTCDPNCNTHSLPPNTDSFLAGSIHVDSTIPISNSISFNIPNIYSQLWIVVDDQTKIDTVSTQVAIDSISMTCSSGSIADITSSKLGEFVYSFATINLRDLVLSTLEWKFPTSSSNSVNPIYDFGGYGIFQVCVSAVDEIGCCTEFCKEIEVLPPPPNCLECEFAPTEAFTYLDCSGGKTLSSLIADGTITPTGIIGGPTIGNFGFVTNFIVCGDLIVDVPITMLNTHFLMESASGITVADNGILRTISSHFEGCTTMWKGINVKKDNIYSGYISTIEDAEYALNLDAAAIVDFLYGNIFRDNYISINAQGNSFNSNSSSFNSTGDLLPNYMGQIGYSYQNIQNTIPQRPYLAIQANNSNILANTNFVANHRNAFSFTACNTTIANNTTINNLFTDPLHYTILNTAITANTITISTINTTVTTRAITNMTAVLSSINTLPIITSFHPQLKAVYQALAKGIKDGYSVLNTANWNQLRSIAYECQCLQVKQYISQEVL